MSATTLEIEEAAALLGRTPSTVYRLARRGRLDAIKVDGRWLVDGASVAAYRPERISRPVRPRLPAEPLLSLVRGRGGPAACGVRQHSAEQRALERARRDGWVTERMADQLAVRLLGLLPFDVWDSEPA